MLLGPLLTGGGDRQVKALMKQPQQQDLVVLQALLEAHSITPVIDRTYPFAELADALRYIETRRARGKVVIDFAD